ncbi:UDP-N-acetylmuramoyl-L-alanyl-D-glutamate--2,6-diaminopimelate ligase [Thiohalophilus sp.]|uniref:UDP-N-acetylmuramoyl-L-alanyl-D-glutamate--2, 6-diaminopimelate ligase n=1 Tax=Thiohalophilus sp. TaxID=3028392 RepID=UPI002ACD36DF|nr:UDP-N-acetylmuramoyl-L-alanyl-D-glutamate--2,6-diaminopimelate ligase [Thiohalophilus sp.]MDZ7662309.1 UDP-N-acetylmuramoyl-L-alanyl-D-glutamate--2,6-diaminopimelate ligase [Thiohalophilus sp.]
MMTVPSTHSAMYLGELLEGRVAIPASLDCPIKDMTMDSRQVVAGSLFVAVKGRQVDGADYIDTAIEQGAVAILRESIGDEIGVTPLSWKTSSTGQTVPVVTLKDLSRQVGTLADRFYGSPSSRLFVVGITGTNGKTSCSQFVAQALKQEKPCGIIGTLGRGLYGQLEDSGHTTPDVIANHCWLAKMRDQGATSVVMEVSSHALDQGRVAQVQFDCAVFTNLTHEHLDYHGEMASYASVKQQLFRTPDLKTAVINRDDAYGREFEAALDNSIKVISYGMQSEYQPTLLAQNIRILADGLQFKVESAYGTGEIRTQLLGRFNISNLLAALGALLAKGLAFDDALTRLASVRTVSGRMETLGGNGQPLVVIDYAHTPDALQHVLEALREHTRGTLWCVFGCGGERDKQKRSLMGKIAEVYADRVVVTNDNPRHENPVDIIEQILSGMSDSDKAYVERDRQKAIESVIQGADEKDVILVAGKGHENYQQVGDERRPFSDLAEAQLQLKRRKA